MNDQSLPYKPLTNIKADFHDAYAVDYDRQVAEYSCYITEALFGLCYDYIQSGQCLLDAGIGSGLSSVLFAKAGLVIHGFDFSPAMLEICQTKGIAADLKRHDIQQSPWPYPSGAFDHLVCCGVLHFIPDLENVFSETRRVLRQSGLFAFTTRVPTDPPDSQNEYEQQFIGGFEIFSHSQVYMEQIMTRHSFEQLKTLRCQVGADVFQNWVTRKQY